MPSTSSRAVGSVWSIALLGSLVVAFLGLLVATILRPVPASAGEADLPSDWSEQGFLGLSVREIPSGDVVMSWIAPGPLAGDGLTSTEYDLGRPDLVVSLNGRPVEAESFGERIHAIPPGSTVTLTYRRSLQRGGTIPDSLDHEEKVETLEVQLGSRASWEGTIRRGRGHDATLTWTDPPRLDPRDPGNVLGEAVARHDLGAAIDTLTGVFAEWQARHEDVHSLAHVRAAFADPFRLAELAARVSAPDSLTTDRTPRTILRWIRELLDLPEVALTLAPLPAPAAALTPEDRLGHLLTRMEEAAALTDHPLDEDQLATLVRNGLTLLRIPHQTFYVGPDSARAALDAMHASIELFGAVEGTLPAFAALPVVLDAAIRAGDIVDAIEALPRRPLPPSLVGVVAGDVRYAEEREGGWLVVGDVGENEYDLAQLDMVIDLGGDDRYRASGLVVGNRVVVDLAGDDVYTGTADQGPASAILGAVVVDDHGGDDRYEGELLSAGAALYGVSILLDRGGADVYQGTEWSLGAAVYGAGIILDLGESNDTYLGDFLCQGVGGPRGLGAIVDAGGRDLYRANGPSDSAYGTAAVYRSFSQGIGFGYRNYAAGGIGLIDDLGGDDRYEAGEFAQGGAYYGALGVLRDRGGRDLYYGNRYGQGFGVHQAHGVLWDEAGDDTYWSMTAASQGAAWDIGTGLLLDEAGNDSYQCDGLGQGGASQQAIALLVDMGGRDRYVARGGAVQGRSGGNAYHFHETGAFSLSVLLDLGGEDDLYSEPGRSNDQSASYGERVEEDPQASPLHGIFVDR
jgi:hypothetical protein